MQERIKNSRERIVLALLLILTAFLTCFNLWKELDGNLYYTAAVKSMLMSWHNFFYASFDPGGFISVDKPGLGLWLQCLFGLIFGVHGWSLILPEAICSIVSVAVLYGIVKKGFGANAGLLAALFLALTPIFVAASRTNNLDASLVMVCLLAVRAGITAAEKGSVKLLILSAVLIGLGFNIKMMQAYVFLPAIYFTYFITADTSWGKRIVHLLISTLVLLAVSLSWCAAVDLTPVQSRPYVGSSSTNSAIELAVGYNGVLRVLSEGMNISGGAGLDTSGDAISQVPNEGGETGLLRLFNRNMAGQGAWLLPLAVFGLAALVILLVKQKKEGRKPALRQLLLWFGLFIPMLAFFSISGRIHRYYMMIFVPVIAALAAIAFTEFYRLFYRSEDTGKNGWTNLLLPVSFLVTATIQLYLLNEHYTKYFKTFAPVILTCAASAVILLLFVKVLKKEKKLLMKLTAAVMILGLVVVPAYWSYIPMKNGANVVAPYGGPDDANFVLANSTKPGSLSEWEKIWYDGGDLTGLFMPREVSDFMIERDNGSRFLVAVPSVAFAVPYIINHGVSVMALGGFVGADKAISLEDFIALVERGELQYFWAPGFITPDAISLWAQTNGTRLEYTEFSNDKRLAGYGTLYDMTVLKGQ